MEFIQSQPLPDFGPNLYFIIIAESGTCDDDLQNQGESGVDCGGPCPACPSCEDGIQNQGETEIDCGGPCTSCESMKN